MSVGPEIAEPRLKISTFSRLSYAAKKGVETYFAKPLYYLFYGSLTITLAGLALGYDFSWKFYAILVTLAAIETYKHFHQNERPTSAE